MEPVGNGYWTVSVPPRRWTQLLVLCGTPVGQTDLDPTSEHVRPAGAPPSGSINDVLDVVYIPYHEKQNDPVLARAEANCLCRTDSTGNGSLCGIHQYPRRRWMVPGTYLPPGYETTPEPYKVMYLAHGIWR